MNRRTSRSSLDAGSGKAGSNQACSRAGFTLLEVTLATALGAMVIMVCVALLRSMERLERPLAIRQQELADLHRARTVIQRAMSTLVMSDTTPPVNPNARRTANSSTSSTSTEDRDAKSAFETTAEATASKQQQLARPPARLLLEPDQSDELKAMLQQVGVPADSAASIQRMEVVDRYAAHRADLPRGTWRCHRCHLRAEQDGIGEDGEFVDWAFQQFLGRRFLGWGFGGRKLQFVKRQPGFHRHIVFHHGAGFGSSQSAQLCAGRNGGRQSAFAEPQR